MQEFIASESSKIFLKGIKKFIERNKIEDALSVNLLLYIKGVDEVGYQFYVDGVFHSETDIKELLGVKVIDMKGYSVIAPPYIYKILIDLREKLKSNAVDVSIFLNEDEDDVNYFVYESGNFVKQVELIELLVFKIEV
jgi:hypothetical protein